MTALARVDNNWSQRRPNMTTVAQNHWGQAGGNRQQHLVYNRNNQTQFQATTIRPGAVGIGFRNNHTLPIRNQLNYPSYPITNRGVSNQTRSNWSQPPLGPQYPSYSQSAFNQTRPGWPQQQPSYPAHGQTSHNYTRPSPTPQYPGYGQGTFNQTRPGWPQPQPAYPAHGQALHNYTRSSPTPHPIHNVPVGPAYPNQPRPAYPQPQRSASNQSHPAWPQPSVPYVPQNPAHGQASFNQSQPTWPQPSAPQQPNYPYNPALPASNLYPHLPNNPNTKPVVPSHSWTPPANQTHLYPQLPNQNLPSSNSNGIPLAPLQPQANFQGPHNWHTGGQSALSYGPGYYPPAGVNTNNNNNPSKPQGSSNPYANMFI